MSWVCFVSKGAGYLLRIKANMDSRRFKKNGSMVLY